MKIVIIEDNRKSAHTFGEILKDLGEVKILTMGDKYQFPEMEEVLTEIKDADVILLDWDLGTYFTGKDLIPYCYGKKVIGISTAVEIGNVQFYGKDSLLSLFHRNGESFLTTKDGQGVSTRLKNLVLSQK